MPIVSIVSPDDPRLDDFRNLTDTALRLRSEHADGLYMAESIKVIERAVRAGHRPRAVMVQERRLADVQRIVTDPAVLIAVVPDAVAEAVTGFDVHRGALASMERPALPTVAAVTEGAQLILIMEDLIEHQNVGAAFRAAAALGADAVLISARCADPLYRRSVRVSMGTVFQVPWTRFDSWERLRADLPDVQIAALALRDDAVALEQFAPRRTARVALALGTEGAGLTAEALRVADTIVTIPMSGGVDSLNVASAGAVALWALRHPPAL